MYDELVWLNDPPVCLFVVLTATFRFTPHTFMHGVSPRSRGRSLLKFLYSTVVVLDNCFPVQKCHIRRIILLVLFHDSYRDGDSLVKRCSRDPNTPQAPMPLSLTQDHAAGEAQMAFLKATEPKSLGICEKPEWI